MNVLTLSGSLRAVSINSALLRVVARLAPPGVVVTSFDIGTLPLFNPDLETQVPAPVARLHAAVAGADGLIIASPEYVHGVSGAIKNALDWLVGLETFGGTPIAVLNASPRAHIADAALSETLVTMSARIVDRASIGFALPGTELFEADMARDATIAASVATVFAELRAAVG